jgi:hypothetical protein
MGYPPVARAPPLECELAPIGDGERGREGCAAIDREPAQHYNAQRIVHTRLEVVEANASCDSTRAIAALEQHVLESRTLVETGLRSNAEEDPRDAGLSSRAEQASV